jgi:hypothetical protein
LPYLLAAPTIGSDSTVMDCIHDNTPLSDQRCVGVFCQQMGKSRRTIEVDYQSSRSRRRLFNSSSIVITGLRAGGPRPIKIGGVIQPWRQASDHSASDSQISKRAILLPCPTLCSWLSYWRNSFVPIPQGYDLFHFRDFPVDLLSEPQARATAILVDELDAGQLKYPNEQAIA